MTKVRPILMGITLLSVAALAFGMGFRLSSPITQRATAELIAAAQESSFYGPKPNWLGMTDSDELFEGIRRRGFAFCFDGREISRECALEQDIAVHDSVLVFVLADAQRKMEDKAKLSRHEAHIAENPQIAADVARFCWNLYRRHGSQDARILAVCLSNLNASSLLVQLPVID